MHNRLTGLVAASYTPFLADGRLNPACIDRQAEYFAASGIAAVFACGTTGECHSLTTSERKEVAARWVSSAAGRFKVVIHVGHNSLPDAQSLAAHAQELGATAIAAMSPFFFKPAGVEELVELCAALAAAAPQLPFYFYDIPSMTGVKFATAEFLERGVERIPTLAGVKFTSTDLMVYQECAAAAGGRFDVLYGHDEMLLPALACGARGAIGSTYNYAAPIYHRLIEAFEKGDLATARRAQLESVRLVRALQGPGVVRGGKVIMSMLGIDCGPVRLPLAPVSRDEARRLYEAIRHSEVFAGRLAAP
jgi:N-acetylneuraminate lyase